MLARLRRTIGQWLGYERELRYYRELYAIGQVGAWMSLQSTVRRAAEAALPQNVEVYVSATPIIRPRVTGGVVHIQITASNGSEPPEAAA